MMQRVSRILFVLLAACLFIGGCEGEKAEDGGKEKQTEGASAEAGPEEDMLKAMQEVADILEANMEDPDKALEAAREYHTTNEAKLKAAMEAVKAKDASLSAEEQEAFWTQVTDRPEYKAFYDMLDQFEARYPDRFGELEEMMNTIQSAGEREDETAEIPDAQVDVAATFTEAEAAYGKLEQMQLSGTTLEALDAAFVDIAKQADTAHTLYETVYQNTDEAELEVKSLVRAADLYALVASRIRSMPQVDGVDAQALELAKTRNAEPLEKRATELYAAAAKAATEKGVDNEFAQRAKTGLQAAPTDGAAAPDAGSEAAPEAEGDTEAAPE